MNAVHNLPDPNKMPYALRPMQERDLAQAIEIERDAFPTLFPPTSFRRELKNRLAQYLVAWRRDDLNPDPTIAPADPTEYAAATPLGNFLARAGRNLWSRRPSAWQPGQQYITGFLGAWYMGDEAHIISVGVRTDYRGSGIGELLLIGAIEQARAHKMQAATLEVRTSNHIAQNLYKKYGFRHMGVRKGYYTDNREDALIMTAAPIRSLSYTEQLRRLIDTHQNRWGSAERAIS